MRTVHDIFLDALTMKHQGMPLHEITRRLVEIGHDNGFTLINERGGVNVVELTFPNGEVIHYDGTDWHHVQP